MPNNDDYRKIHEVLTIKELQALLRVSKNTAYNLVHSGEIRAKAVGRQLRIPRSEVERYLNT